MFTMNRALLTLLICLSGACAPKAECEIHPELCTWALASASAVIEGTDYNLAIAVNGKLQGIGSSAKMTPVVVKQGAARSSLKIELSSLPSSECAKASSSFESIYCFGAIVPAAHFATFTPGQVQIAVPREYYESDSFKTPDSSKRELELTYKSPLKIASSPITYLDTDPDSPDGFPFPIRLLPGKWKNPMSDREEDVIFSLHRGIEAGTQKRQIKLLKFGAGSPSQLTLNPQQGVYASSILDYESPMSTGHYVAWGELLPTIIRADVQGLLLSRLSINPNYGLRECVGNEPLIRDCPTRVDDTSANLLLPDTRALSGQAVAGGGLLARADATGNVSTTVLQDGSMLQGGNWKSVPTSTPIPSGERIFFSFGKLLAGIDQNLLVTTQNPVTRNCSTALLFAVSAMGQATEITNTNLKNLLINQKVDALEVGALDQDALPDVVYAADGELHFLLNKGSGEFERSNAKAMLPSTLPVTSIAITDVDRDGKADVIIAQDKSVHVLINQN